MNSRIIEARAPNGDYYSYSEPAMKQGGPSESPTVVTGARAVVKIGGQTIPFANVSYTYQVTDVRTAEFKGQVFMRKAKIPEHQKQIYRFYRTFNRLYKINADIHFSGTRDSEYNGWSLQSFRISVRECSQDRFDAMNEEAKKREQHYED